MAQLCCAETCALTFVQERYANWYHSLPTFVKAFRSFCTILRKEGVSKDQSVGICANIHLMTFNDPNPEFQKRTQLVSNMVTPVKKKTSLLNWCEMKWSMWMLTCGREGGDGRCKALSSSAPIGTWAQRCPLRQQRTEQSSWRSRFSPLWHSERTYRTPPVTHNTNTVQVRKNK